MHFEEIELRAVHQRRLEGLTLFYVGAMNIRGQCYGWFKYRGAKRKKAAKSIIGYNFNTVPL